MIGRPRKLRINKEKFISLISGSEAGIATTAAIIAGLVIGTDDRSVVVLSTLIAITVQAFNSSIAAVFASHAEDEIERNRDMDSLLAPLAQGGLQFLTHITAGMIVLLPIVYVTSLQHALVYSISISLVFLLWIGLYVGHVVRHSPLKNGLQSFCLGVLIILGGFAAGYVIN